MLARLRRWSAGAAALRADYSQELLTDTVPARIVNLHRVRGLPLIGVLLAGLLGTIVLVSTLTISARARGRELAVMRALGLPSRRIRSVLGWQGVILAACMLVVGIPIGLGVGIWGWHQVASGLGVSSAVSVPAARLRARAARAPGRGGGLDPAGAPGSAGAGE